MWPCWLCFNSSLHAGAETTTRLGFDKFPPEWGFRALSHCHPKSDTQDARPTPRRAATHCGTAVAPQELSTGFGHAGNWLSKHHHDPAHGTMGPSVREGPIEWDDTHRISHGALGAGSRLRSGYRPRRNQVRTQRPAGLARPRTALHLLAGIRRGRLLASTQPQELHVRSLHEHSCDPAHGSGDAALWRDPVCVERNAIMQPRGHLHAPTPPHSCINMVRLWRVMVSFASNPLTVTNDRVELSHFSTA